MIQQRARPECDYEDQTGKIIMGGCKAQAHFMFMFYVQDEHEPWKLSPAHAKIYWSCRHHAKELHKYLTIMGAGLIKMGEKNLKLTIVDATRTVDKISWEMCKDVEDYHQRMRANIERKLRIKYGKGTLVLR